MNYIIWMMAKYLFELFLLGSSPVSLALPAAGIVHFTKGTGSMM
jgi:hypothetical protein